eukprot:1419868-Amphidinium_carterae.2
MGWLCVLWKLSQRWLLWICITSPCGNMGLTALPYHMVTAQHKEIIQMMRAPPSITPCSAIPPSTTIALTTAQVSVFGTSRHLECRTCGCLCQGASMVIGFHSVCGSKNALHFVPQPVKNNTKAANMHLTTQLCDDMSWFGPTSIAEPPTNAPNSSQSETG